MTGDLWAETIRKQHCRRYVTIQLDGGGSLIPGTEVVREFGDSNTLLGIRIGGKVVLSFEDAIGQCQLWNDAHGSELQFYYAPYAPELEEAGVTPLLPGMTDRDVMPRTPATVGHVGQGGVCWCGGRHADYDYTHYDPGGGIDE